MSSDRAPPSRLHGSSRLVLLGSVLLHGSLAFPAPAASRQDVTFSGTVVDAGSGAPVSGALLTLVGPGRQVITDADGRFTVVDAPDGAHRLRVQRYGYRQLERDVTVSEGMAPLELRLEPDPIQLDELTVMGNARADVSGVVLDARSGEPIPFTDVTLTEGAVRQVGRRAAADDRGEFNISDIPTGAYLLRVERLGYQGQYLPVYHGAPPLPIEVRLEADSALMRGVAEVHQRLRQRQRAHGRTTLDFDEQRLRISALPSMLEFMDLHVRSYRTLFIDGMPACPGRTSCEVKTILSQYMPADFFRVEVFECGGTPVARGARLMRPIPEVHMYTYEYMERMGRRPRLPLPPCL